MTSKKLTETQKQLKKKFEAIVLEINSIFPTVDLQTIISAVLQSKGDKETAIQLVIDAMEKDVNKSSEKQITKSLQELQISNKLEEVIDLGEEEESDEYHSDEEAEYDEEGECDEEGEYDEDVEYDEEVEYDEDAIESPITTGIQEVPAPRQLKEEKQKPKKKYVIWNAEDLEKAIQEDTFKAQEVLHIPEQSARIILKGYKWNTEKLLQDFIDHGKEYIFKKCGVVSDEVNDEDDEEGFTCFGYAPN